mgnify:CR=1 FL=1
MLEYYKEFIALLAIVVAYVGGRETKKIQNKKDSAIAEQEEIKIKKEDVSLSMMIQSTYQKLNKDVFLRLEFLEESNKDLTDKYNEILLRNGILEEKAESYEKKYEKLKTDYVKLKMDYDKVHRESKQLREEINLLKTNIA